MLKRLAVILSLVAVLVVISEPSHPVSSTVMTADELAMVNDNAKADDVQAEKKSGNRVVKVFTYPFKAIGRLFGFGKKQDDNKFHKLAEKDVKKFETAGITRVTDARSAPASPTSDDAAPAPAVLDQKSTLTPDQTLARIYLDDGRKAFSNNDLNGTVAALTKAVSLDSKLYDAHNLLGISYEMKGMRRSALDSLEASLKGDHDKAEHLNDYGYLLMQNGDYHDAVKYLKRAVKAKADERFFNNLALAQTYVGKYDDAYKNFERAVGEFQAHLNMGTRLQRFGQDKDAIKHLEKARSMHPENMGVLTDLIALYQRTGQGQEAAEANKVLITLRTNAAAPGKQ